MSLTFAAIDVETANSNRGSVCSFGVAVVRDGQVADKYRLLTQPPVDLNWFDAFNIAIHGICPEDVADQPGFGAQLEVVLEVVGDLPVVAHNAAFDIGAIRSACLADGIDWPTLTYGCSLVMSRRADLNLVSYRLPVVCEALGVQMGVHHCADDDAEAAAGVVLALAGRIGATTLDELTTSLMIRLGRITHTEWAGCIRAPERPQGNLDADRDHPLYGKLIAFTGGLSIVRNDAWSLVADLGATPQQGPTKETDFLVIGDGFTGNSAADFHTGKAVKAVKINSKGGHIEVLTEGDLLDLLAEPTTSGMRTDHQAS